MQPQVLIYGDSPLIQTEMIQCLADVKLLKLEQESGEINQDFSPMRFVKYSGAHTVSEFQNFCRRKQSHFDPEQNESQDIIWFCLGPKTSEELLDYIIHYPGRYCLVLCEAKELERKAYTSFRALLKTKGLNDHKLITVSSHNGTGLARLVEQTFSFWGDSYDAQKIKNHTMLALLRNRESQRADSYIFWAAGRAFFIAACPLPMADIGPLLANEAYMFFKVGKAYGYATDKAALTSFIGCIGASIGGMVLASWLPLLKVPVAAGVTYAVGKAAQVYFESNMTLDQKKLKKVFADELKKGKKMDWKAIVEKLKIKKDSMPPEEYAENGESILPK